MPADEKLAVVSTALALPKVTVPGPLNLVQVWVTVLPEGRPSSVTVPSSDADAGSVTLASVPALTVGA